MTAQVSHLDAAPLDSPTYIPGRSEAWQTLSKICKDDKCWTHAKLVQRQRDGRGVFQALHTHCLGANHINNMASVAGAKLAQAKCCGEKRRYNVKPCVSSLTKQFQVLNTFKRYGHAGVDESSKVPRLNTGSKTDKLTSMTLSDCTKISSPSRGLRMTMMNSMCWA
jgi:hypothetical protein